MLYLIKRKNYELDGKVEGRKGEEEKGCALPEVCGYPVSRVVVYKKVILSG